MEKPQFVEFLKENILPIFTGSEISGEEESSPRDALVAQGVGGSILVKFRKSDNYRVIIKRIQPFKAFEVSLIKSIITELITLYNQNLGTEYYNSLQEFVIEKAVSQSVSQQSYQTLLDIFTQLKVWGRRTYEGQRIRFGFLVSTKKAPKGINSSLHIKNFMNYDFSALVSNGVDTCVELSADGFVMGYTDVPKSGNLNLFAPYEFLGMAKLTHGNKVGVSLDNNGDILVFHDRTLIFAKRNGEWIRFSHEEIVDRLCERATEGDFETRKAMYLSALDTSFARTGGAIVHLNKSEEEAVIRHVDSADIMLEEYYLVKCNQNIQLSFFSSIDDEVSNIMPYEEFLRSPNCTKTVNLRRIVAGRKFSELSRKLRQELLSIDGATILDNNGKILAAGAIIMIEAGSVGGGRLAATKTLARYGVSIKISADGGIQGFKMEKSKVRPVPIFILG